MKKKETKVDYKCLEISENISSNQLDTVNNLNSKAEVK